MTTLKIHPSADWLPELEESEYQELRDDIAKRGLREPILVKRGFIVDGRHRYRASQELGVEPAIQEYEGSDIIDEIASRNLFRRNLTPEQRAALVVKMLGDKLSAEARERQRCGLKAGKKSPVTLKSASRGETAEKIAAMAQVGRDVARRALHAHRDGVARKRKLSAPVIDKLDPIFIQKKFERFMSYWAPTQYWKVYEVLRAFLEH
jgi:ParB-like chromosome segregation protein Spo0J